MAEHLKLGKRKRRSSSPPCPDDRNTETEVIHPSSRIIKQRRTAPPATAGVSSKDPNLGGSEEGKLTSGGTEKTTAHYPGILTEIESNDSSRTATRSAQRRASSANEHRNSRGRTTINLIAADDLDYDATFFMPYALKWNENNLEVKISKSFESSGIARCDIPPLRRCTPVAGSNGQFIIVCGPSPLDKGPGPWTNETYLLSVTEQSLTLLGTRGDKLKQRVHYEAAIVGRVLVLFGGDISDDYLHFLHLDSLEWSNIRPPAPYPGPRSGHSLIVVGSTIWVFGGQLICGSIVFDDMWCIDLGNLDDIHTLQWREISQTEPWPKLRSYHSTVYYNGCIYLFGGLICQSSDVMVGFDEIWKFNIRAETWAEVQCNGSVPRGRWYHSTTVIGDNMFIYGGVAQAAQIDETVRLDDAFVFNLRNHTWRSLALRGSKPPPTCGATMSTMGSRLVLVGGSEWDMRVHVAEIQSARDVRDSLVKLQFTTETTHRQFTTEVVDLSRFVRKQGDGAYALAGYSDIWRGEMTDTGQSIAIKVLRITSPSKFTPTEKTRFDRELSIWMECQHPRVLELLGYAYIEGIPCLISPWCENGNIMEHLKKNPNENRLQIVIQVAEGLVYLHGRDPPVIHSDVKPANVLINESGDAKICDFGISKLMMDTPSGFTTTKGANFTLRYSSKELLCEGKNSMMSDVFAFGMLVLEVMTNKHPFFKILLEAMVVIAITNGETPSPEEYPELPAADPLWDIMKECWDAEPTKRPTMVEVLDKLRERAQTEQP